MKYTYVYFYFLKNKVKLFTRKIQTSMIDHNNVIKYHLLGTKNKLTATSFSQTIMNNSGILQFF